MRGVNRVILVGNLGKDPEMRYTAGGDPVANFSLATNKRRRDGDDWKEETTWHQVVAFGKTAKACGDYLHKGSSVYVEGELVNDRWQTRDGEARQTVKVQARDIQFLDAKGQGAPAGQGQKASPPPAQDADFDDEIPF